MSTAIELRLAIHSLAAAYDNACAEYGEDSDRALLIADAVEFMRRWMLRYGTLAPRRTLEAVRD